MAFGIFKSKEQGNPIPTPKFAYVCIVTDAFDLIPENKDYFLHLMNSGIEQLKKKNQTFAQLWSRLPSNRFSLGTYKVDNVKDEAPVCFKQYLAQKGAKDFSNSFYQDAQMSPKEVNVKINIMIYVKFEL